MKTTKFLTSMLVIIALAFTACTNANDPDGPDKDDPKTENKLPFSEKFDTGLGKFTTQNVSGDQVWEFSTQYKYALISGYVNATNNANEDWLISPQIDLAGVTAAKLSFEHASRYFGNIAEEATVWVSENYVDGLPATAAWSKVTTPAFSDKGTWTMETSGEISLTAFAGKKIKIALKYVSTANKAGSWQLKNFLVEEGEAEDNGGNTGVGEGTGTEADPYDVTNAIANQGAMGWVEGYIVGNVDGEGMSISTEANFASPFTIATNMLIAASATETDYTKCLPVQLPSGAVREGLNLVDNGTNLGLKVKLYGSFESYFGVSAIKGASYYELEGGATGGTKPVDTSDAIFTESFTTDQGDFTIQDIALPEGGSYVWKWASYSSSTYMIASAYIDGEDKAAESWLISPAIDLSAATTATLTFEQALNYLDDKENISDFVSVWVSTDYTTGDPTTGTWTELTPQTLPTGGSWSFVGSGDISLADVVGQSNVRLAFKYLSIDGDAPSWEVKNIVVK